MYRCPRMQLSILTSALIAHRWMRSADSQRRSHSDCAYRPVVAVSASLRCGARRDASTGKVSSVRAGWKQRKPQNRWRPWWEEVRNVAAADYWVLLNVALATGQSVRGIHAATEDPGVCGHRFAKGLQGDSQDRGSARSNYRGRHTRRARYHRVLNQHPTASRREAGRGQRRRCRRWAVPCVGDRAWYG